MSTFTLPAAIFVKTPGYSPLKTRLAVDVGRETAEAFYCGAVTCVAEVMETARERLAGGGIELVPQWAVAESEAIGDPLWSGFPQVEQGAGGLGERLNRVYRELTANHSGALLLGADLPQLRPEAIAAAARDLYEFHSAGVSGFHIGRVNDGGFSLFGGIGNLPADVWTAVTYSASTTADELIGRLQPFGEVRESHLGDDVDTLPDLKRVEPVLDRPDALPSQRALAEWLRTVELP